MSPRTVDAVLRDGIVALRDAGIPDAATDARRLMAAVLKATPAQMTAALRDPISPSDEGAFADALARRLQRQPVSQIIGGRWFYGRWFRVTPDVLDPRPETETLVDLALGSPFAHVLDLGTGSGAIIVTLLAERPAATGVGTDLSETGILVAGENAAHHGVDNRLILPVSDWWEDVGGTYDLIVSNPPYVAADEMPSLAPEVRDWEPRLALTDEADGLSAYRTIAAGAPDHLTAGGRLLVEIGYGQAEAVSRIFAAAGLENIAVHTDLNGRDRVVSARRC
ncbi:MAG: peptide chain release factor N(5)-glutamine methyltransferase [Pseudomonadota bacterium]